MKLRYLTKYPFGRHWYGSDIWAKSAEEAQKIAHQRKIGETVIGHGMKGGGLKRPVTKIEKLHEATFLSWIAIEMGLLSPRAALGDEGIVHEMVHSLNGRRVKGLEKRFRALQKLIPGHRP